MINELLIKKVDEYLENEKFISYGERYFKTNNLKLHPFDDFKLTSWDNWEVDPFKNRSWQWKLNWFSFVPYFLAYYHSTKDDKVLDEIKISINSWLNQYIDKDTSSFEFVWHDHAMALRAEQMVFFYVYTLNYSKKWFEENNIFFEYMLSGIKKHALLLSKDEYFTKYTNHGLEQARVLLILGLFLDDIESEKYQKLAISRIKDELLFAFTNEGVHVENSPAYHIFVLKVFMGIIKDFPKELLGDLSEQFDSIATKALSFITHIIRPDGTLPPIGDTEQLKTSDAYSLIYSNTQEYKELLYALTQGKKGIKPKKLNQVYKNSGYAIFRDQWFDKKNYKQALHLIAKIGCLSQYHNQQDEGHISLYAFSEDWLIDSGMYNHNNTDSIRKYMRSRLAHNVPLISNTKYDSDFSHRVNNWEVIDFSEDENNPNVKIKLKVLENVIHNRNINLHTQDKVINIDDIFEFEDNQSRDITLQWHIPVDKTITISESLNQVSIVSKTGNTLILDIIGDTPDKIYIQKGINKDKVISVVSHISNSYVDSQVLKILFAKKSLLKVSSKFTFTSNLQNIQKDEVVVQEKPIKVFIFGSCVSRDPFEIADERDFEIIDYVARTSIASLSAEPYVDENIVKNIPSKWQQRMVLGDMNKSFFSKLLNTSFDVLLIDLIDERFNLSIKGQSVHTISSEYKKALYTPNSYRSIKRFSDEKFRLWEKGLEKLVTFLKKNRLENKIVLNKVYWTHKIGQDGIVNERYSPQDIKEANDDLKRMYTKISTLLPYIKTIEYPENQLFTDPSHKWGVEPFHYNENIFKRQLGVLYVQNAPDIYKLKHPIYGTYNLNTPIDWRINPYNNRNWIHHFMSLRWLDNIKFTELDIKEILVGFYNFHVKKKVNNPYYFDVRGDHTSAIRLQQLLEFKKIFEKSNDLSGIGISHRLIIAELENMQQEKMYRKGHNHGLMLDNSLLKCAIESNEYKKYINVNKICTRAYETLLFMWHNYGLTKEHSVSYQEYNLPISLEALDLINALSPNLSIDITKDSIINETKKFLRFSLRNNGEYLPLGDSFREPNINILNEVLVNSNEYKNASDILFSFSQQEGVYCNKEFFIFRRRFGDKNIHFATTCGWNSHHHKQNDELSFLLEIDDELIFDDPGYSEFIEWEKICFLQSELAHSTITIDEIPWKNKQNPDSTSIIKDYQIIEDGFSVVLQHQRIDNVVVERKFTLNTSLFKIEDKVSFFNNDYDGKLLNTSFVLNPEIKVKINENNNCINLQSINTEYILEFDNGSVVYTEDIPYVPNDRKILIDTSKVVISKKICSGEIKNDFKFYIK